MWQADSDLQLTQLVPTQLLDECLAALKRYPTTLEQSREELRQLEGEQPDCILADILRVRIQEQKILARTVFTMREQKAKLLGKPF